MATKDLFKIKIRDLRYTYGDEEADYFASHPKCEICPEDRFVALSIHHTHGKDVKKFKTLCHNCHAVVHATKTGDMTYDKYIKAKKEKDAKKLKRLKFLKEAVDFLFEKGYSLRQIGRELKISHNTVRNYLNK